MFMGVRKNYPVEITTYHSWREYTRQNPDWNKHISSRIAGELAKLKLKEEGFYVERTRIIPFDPVTHRAVEGFLKTLDEAEEATKNSKLRFMVKGAA